MYNLLFRNARVVDGTGTPWFHADVALEGSRIAAVGDLPGASATQVIDVDGAVLAPGFIDLHTHTDFTLPLFPRADSMVRQGVTTVVTGNCGLAPFPINRERFDLLHAYVGYHDGGLTWEWKDTADFAAFLDRQPLACNVALLVAHDAVRLTVMGFDNRIPTDRELAEMQRVIALAFEQGVFGLSTGLVYSPGYFARTEELIALAAVGRGYGAFYASHIRGESNAVVMAVQEAIAIGKAAGVPVQLSQHKLMGKMNWGRVKETLALIDQARAEGQDVLADQYPYPAGSTGLIVFLPKWATDGGTTAILARLADAGTRTRIRAEILSPSPTALEDGARDFEPDTLMLSLLGNEANKPYEGMTVGQVARLRGEAPVDTALHLLESERTKVRLVIMAMCEDDVRTIMRHPAVAIASDGSVLHPSVGGRPHPRNYGTFVRVLGKYVREEKVLRLEDAIRKMTSLPAQRLRRNDLGLVRPGCMASLVVFDPDSVRDCATFEEPHQFAEGVYHVVVNGHLVIQNGQDTGNRAGRVLRRRQP